LQIATDLNTEKVKTEVYPNPFIDYITISSQQEIIKSVIIVSITSSTELYFNVNSNSIQLNLSKLTSGLYFAHITLENDTIEVIKIQKK